MTHLLNLLDNVCKYEMDPASIVEDTERHDSVHRWTDGQGETSIPPFNLVEQGYNDVALNETSLFVLQGSTDHM